MQVLVSGLADTWLARKTWTPEQLLVKYGSTPFKISQKSAKKLSMKFEDYVSYMQEQHDEDPLYIFDDKVVYLACIVFHFPTLYKYFITIKT